MILDFIPWMRRKAGRPAGTGECRSADDPRPALQATPSYKHRSNGRPVVVANVPLRVKAVVVLSGELAADPRGGGDGEFAPVVL